MGGGGGVPAAKTDDEIAASAELEVQRVKFEDEKRRFIERVGAYETMTSDFRQGRANSLERDQPLTPGGGELMGRQTFDPTFDPTTHWAAKNKDGVYKVPKWFEAPNLGLQIPGKDPNTPKGASNFNPALHGTTGYNRSGPNRYRYEQEYNQRQQSHNPMTLGLQGRLGAGHGLNTGGTP